MGNMGHFYYYRIIESRQNMKRSGENDPYDPYLVTMKHGWSANMGYTRSFLLVIALSG